MEQDGTWRAFIGSFLSDPVDFIQLHWPWLLFANGVTINAMTDPTSPLVIKMALSTPFTSK